MNEEEKGVENWKKRGRKKVGKREEVTEKRERRKSG
jgi:hypothetical protein